MNIKLVFVFCLLSLFSLHNGEICFNTTSPCDNGDVYPDTESCTVYYQCIEETIQQLTCKEDGDRFDIHLKRCAYNETDYDCTDQCELFEQQYYWWSSHDYGRYTSTTSTASPEITSNDSDIATTESGFVECDESLSDGVIAGFVTLTIIICILIGIIVWLIHKQKRNTEDPTMMAQLPDKAELGELTEQDTTKKRVTLGTANSAYGYQPPLPERNSLDSIVAANQPSSSTRNSINSTAAANPPALPDRNSTQSSAATGQSDRKTTTSIASTALPPLPERNSIDSSAANDSKATDSAYLDMKPQKDVPAVESADNEYLVPESQENKQVVQDDTYIEPVAGEQTYEESEAQEVYEEL